MSYNAKNYTEQGGGKTVIGGEIDLTGATVTGLAATAAKAGIAKQSTKVAEAAGSAPTKAEFDALIAALVTAGIMAAS